MGETSNVSVIPEIRVEFCRPTDHRYHQTELLNINNNVITDGKNQPDSLSGGVLWLNDSQRTGINSESQLGSESAWPKKVPRRKNGLGIRTSNDGWPKDSCRQVTALFLDAPLSQDCTEELSKQSTLPVPIPNKTLGKPRRALWDDVQQSRLTVPSVVKVNERKISTCDLEELKKTTARLKLTTRRPSFVAWHDRYVKRPQSLSQTYTIPETEETDLLSSEQTNRINQNLERIKSDLVEMRTMDKNLAKNLLSLRKDINKLKLEMSCQEHECLLEDAQDELEALQELSELCDFPLEELSFGQTLGPLKTIGVTRLNLSARRFSTC